MGSTLYAGQPARRFFRKLTRVKSFSDEVSDTDSRFEDEWNVAVPTISTGRITTVEETLGDRTASVWRRKRSEVSTMSDKSLSAHRPTPVARPMRFRAPRCTSYVLRRRVANGGMAQATGNARAHGCVIHNRLRGPRRHAV